MIHKLKILVLFFTATLTCSCSKDSNSNGNKGTVRYEISIIEGVQNFDITLSTNAVAAKILDLDTGELVPDDSVLPSVVQTIDEARSSYSLESDQATINMGVSLSFIEKEVSSGTPIKLEVECYFNDALQDSYSYDGEVILLGKFDFSFISGTGLNVIGEPKS